MTGSRGFAVRIAAGRAPPVIAGPRCACGGDSSAGGAPASPAAVRQAAATGSDVELRERALAQQALEREVEHERAEDDQRSAGGWGDDLERVAREERTDRLERGRKRSESQRPVAYTAPAQAARQLAETASATTCSNQTPPTTARTSCRRATRGTQRRAPS